MSCPHQKGPGCCKACYEAEQERVRKLCEQARRRKA
jgi:hypothetical protein